MPTIHLGGREGRGGGGGEGEGKKGRGGGEREHNFERYRYFNKSRQIVASKAVSTKVSSKTEYKQFLSYRYTIITTIVISCTMCEQYQSTVILKRSDPVAPPASVHTGQLLGLELFDPITALVLHLAVATSSRDVAML